MLRAGHAENALPQSATATVNCRIFPGVPASQVEQVLREQARAGGISGGARDALDATLAGLRRRSGEAGSGGSVAESQGGSGGAGSQ